MTTLANPGPIIFQRCEKCSQYFWFNEHAVIYGITKHKCKNKPFNSSTQKPMDPPPGLLEEKIVSGEEKREEKRENEPPTVPTLERVEEREERVIADDSTAEEREEEKIVGEPTIPPAEEKKMQSSRGVKSLIIGVLGLLVITASVYPLV